MDGKRNNPNIIASFWIFPTSKIAKDNYVGHGS